MNLNFFKEKIQYVKWILIVLGVVIILGGMGIGAAFGMSQKYAGKIYPGVKIDGIDASGMTREQARNAITDKFSDIYKNGFVFYAADIEKTIPNDAILGINTDSMVDSAYRLGRGDNWIVGIMQFAIFPIFPKEISFDYTLDKTALQKQLQVNFGSYEKPAVNANISIKIIDLKQKTFEVEFLDSTAGEAFKYEKAITQFETFISQMQNPKIELRKEIDVPEITKEQALPLKDKAIEILNLKEIVFQYEKEEWPMKWEDVTHWLQVGLDDSDNVRLVLNKEMIEGQLNSIGQTINKEAVDAKFQIKDGRVNEFVGHQTGKAIDIDESYAFINSEIITNLNPKITLIVKETLPSIKTEDLNQLGIKEKIGTGVSNFAGSPVNRRHNIGVGAAKLNGLLIAPGEEFKLVSNLLPFDGQSGYLPELVIKGDKTIPEYGGGLCQIATTLFRVALSSGLPITQRAPHAYRVVYYEPAGTDATIYDPAPDVRFINDTGSHILIQTKIVGNLVTFEFWGTSDGRKVSFEGNNKTEDLTKLKPVIFNITSPGPVKYIETADLKPGEKKQTESAHNGADAYFYQYITKIDGTTEKKTWSSHYTAWRSVVLVGIDPNNPLTPPATEIPAN